MKYLIPFLLVFSCNSAGDSTQAKNQNVYQNTVGDIPFDRNMDDPDFTLCRPYFISPQYYWDKFNYGGEMSAIKTEFEEKYDFPKSTGQTGFLTVRFIVNCKGRTGRFRTFSVNSNLKEYSFKKEITNKLLEITRSLTEWKIQVSDGGLPRDYYQYLTFKLVDGRIQEITP